MKEYGSLLQPEKNNRRRLCENILVLTTAVLTIAGLCGYNDQETVEAGTTALPKNNCTVNVMNLNNDGTVNGALGSDCKGAFGQRNLPVGERGKDGKVGKGDGVGVGDTLVFDPNTNELVTPSKDNPEPTPSSNPDTAFSITPEATSSSK